MMATALPFASIRHCKHLYTASSVLMYTLEWLHLVDGATLNFAGCDDDDNDDVDEFPGFTVYADV